MEGFSNSLSNRAVSRHRRISCKKREAKKGAVEDIRALAGQTHEVGRRRTVKKEEPHPPHTRFALREKPNEYETMRPFLAVE